jgi:hypothetical protein
MYLKKLTNLGFTKEQVKLINKLDTPSKIQDFISKMGVNFEENGDSCMSPLFVLKKKRCHCMEGALLGSFLLSLIGFKPLVVDMQGTADDWDHVLAVFQVNGFWGAISKTNHSVLRYREPVYKSVRELIMSYFNEYTSDKTGRKTLRTFSVPVNLNKFNYLNWINSPLNLFEIPEYLDKVKHFTILNKKQIKNLRALEKIELKAGNMRQFKLRKNFKKKSFF